MEHPTLSSILPTVVTLEKQTMALYMRFAKLFQQQQELQGFWLSMAHHEAGHIGALCLVEGTLSNDAALAEHSHGQQVQQAEFDLSTVEHLQGLLQAYNREATTGLSIERAFAMAIEIESSELEDVVVELLLLVKEKIIRDHAIKLLIHDLSDLSYMIERYTRDEHLLAQVDALVEHRLDTFSAAQPEERREVVLSA
jgi:hypothetical protein